MAKRKLVLEGDETLRKKSREVTEFNAKLGQLLDDMAETMYAYDGAGLAAVQVGVLRRAVVIDAGGGLRELVNPVMLETRDTQTGGEGCLSFPDKWGEVTRPKWVKVKAQDKMHFSLPWRAKICWPAPSVMSWITWTGCCLWIWRTKLSSPTIVPGGGDAGNAGRTGTDPKKGRLRMRIVFMGTPEFAVPCLRQMLEEGRHLAGVFTQPDKPKGRGHRLAAPPVKELALLHGIPVYQPKSMRTAESAELLRSLAPDLVVVTAYGKILPQEILEIPPLG